MEPGIARAGNSNCLQLDLIVEPYEGVCVAADGARVLGYPGGVLVLNYVQFERVGLV